MNDAWLGLVGVIVGGAITTLATVWMDARREKIEAKKIAHAVAGELAAAKELVTRRKFLEGIREFRDMASSGVVAAFSVHLPSDPLIPVTRASVANIGSLNGELPRLIPQIVLWCDGLAADIRRLAVYGVGGSDSLISQENSEAAAEMYGEMELLLSDFMDGCDRVVAEVDRLYPRS